jgi:hypothetical protein
MVVGVVLGIGPSRFEPIMLGGKWARAKKAQKNLAHTMPNQNVKMLA